MIIVVIMIDDAEMSILKTEQTDKNTDRTVSNMGMGEVGYTLPWKLAKSRGRYYLQTDAPVSNESHGTFSLRIIKMNDGIVVDESTAQEPVGEAALGHFAYLGVVMVNKALFIRISS